MIKVCYFTSKNSNDTRVYEKECISLVAAGYQVYLVCPNSKSEIKDGIQLVGFEYTKKGIINRLLILPRLLYKKALQLDADIYHFNDPASLYYGLKLKKRGKKVIFDSFEDHPSLIFEKKFIPYFIKFIISKIYTIYEFNICKQLDGIITCYHWTQNRLEKACSNCKLVFNFPKLKNEILSQQRIASNTICYAGLISRMWFVENILKAASLMTDVSVIIAGNPADKSYLKSLRATSGWEKVNYLGQLRHSDVYDKVYSQANVGMVLLDYIPLCRGNIGNLSNNKLFEYLKAGLPVICTDFILWKEVIEKYNCGICVNPRNVNEIVEAIKFFNDNPDITKQMGENGQKAILEKYNWAFEEKKMLEVYNQL